MTNDPARGARRGTVAFVCAMPMELVPLTEALSLVERPERDLVTHHGELGDFDVVAIVTGMGTELARRGTEALLEVADVERVVVVGITGALDNEIPIGTLILPEVVVHSGTGEEYRPHHLGREAPQGVMWTTDVLITDDEALTGLRGRGVVGLDMETAAIAAVCEARGIPWSVFRAISDRASDGSVDAEVFAMSNQDGTPNHEAIADFFERHPDRAAQLAEMGENAARAAGIAADAAIASVAALADPSSPPPGS